MDRTLLIIKPDATGRNLIGHVINRLEKAGFRIDDMRMVRLDETQARQFYAVHEGKPFLDSLVAFMTSGPVVPMVLVKDNAVADLRTLVGATNPEETACGSPSLQLPGEDPDRSVCRIQHDHPPAAVSGQVQPDCALGESTRSCHHGFEGSS